MRAFLPAGVEGAVGMQGGLGDGDGQGAENRDVIEIRDPVKGTTHVYYRFRGGEEEGDSPYCAKGMEKLRYGEVFRIGGDGDREGKSGNGEEADDSKDSDEDGATEFVDHVSSGVNDILIVGETGGVHGTAWGQFGFVGRVRSWDGLVVVVRYPLDALAMHIGARWILRGYVHAGDVWAGRWRETATGIAHIGFEGGFALVRAR